MNIRGTAIAFAALFALAGCAAQPSDPLAARRAAYQRLDSVIAPGMTRRQLYALLPPARIPTAKPSALLTSEIITQPAARVEEHPLDSDFSLTVQYRVANLREYPPCPAHKGISNHKRYYSPRDIDDLVLARFREKPVPSHQNPNDILVARPVVSGPGATFSGAIETVDDNDTVAQVSAKRTHAKR